MSTPIYDFVMENLRAKRISQRKIALGSGVPFDTLTKIAQGRIKDPSVHNIQRLYDFFTTHAANDAPHESAANDAPHESAAEKVG